MRRTRDHSRATSNEPGGYPVRETPYAWALGQILDQDSFSYLQRFRGAYAPARAAQLARYVVWLSGQTDSLDAEAIAILAIAYIDCGADPLGVAANLDLPLPPEWG